MDDRRAMRNFSSKRHISKSAHLLILAVFVLSFTLLNDPGPAEAQLGTPPASGWEMAGNLSSVPAEKAETPVSGQPRRSQSESPLFASVSAGDFHTCGVGTAGTVQCWGDLRFRQSIAPAGRFKSVSAGAFHTCGVRVDGTVQCWGYIAHGRSSPPEGGFVSVSSGMRHTCGIRDDDTVACWGDNEYGQSSPPAGVFASVSAGRFRNCGVRTDGTVACWGRGTFGEVSPPEGTFTFVSAGEFHTCGIRTNDAVACWGSNIQGESSPPADRFTLVSAGRNHTCGVRTDGTVGCWGGNEHKQSRPPSGTFTSVSAGGFHTCGVRADAAIQCWGRPYYGQSNPPEAMFDSISSGEFHTCGIKADNTVACWGNDEYGQSNPPEGTFTSVSAGTFHTCGIGGDGTVQCWGDLRYRQSIPPADRFTSVSAGGFHTCGIRLDGTVACWGNNAYGQSSPPAGAFTSVSSRRVHACGIRDDDTVACWGNNDYGQSSPLTGKFVSISAGDWHTCGLRTDGSVNCWGSDAFGQSSPPAEAFVSISAGDWHTCGLRTDGAVQCWGTDGYGQSSPPADTFDLVSAGRFHSCGVRQNGAVQCWGPDAVRPADDASSSPSQPVVEAFAHNPAMDFNTLIAAGNATPEAFWSDGTTVWVSDARDRKIYAYNLATKQRDSAKDFNTLAAAGNISPHGVWSDGTTMWVANNTRSENSKIYAYNLATKQRDGAKDFDTLHGAHNNRPDGIWADGTTMWVSDWDDGKIYAYNLATKQRDDAKDFETLSAAANNNPDGVWADETTMWVSDPIDQKIYAYDLATKQRDSAKDFNTLSAAGNNNPAGIWSDATTMWVTDWGDGKIYAYNMPTGTSSVVQPPFDSEECETELTEDGSVGGTWSSECASQHPDRSGSYARYFTFETLEESDVTITLQSDSIEDGDTYLYLRRGEGQREGSTFLQNDDHGDDPDNDFDLPQYASGITATLQPGHYTTEATTYDSGQTGDFTLRVSGLDPAVTQPSVPATGLIAFVSTRDRDVDVHVMEVDEGSVTDLKRLTDDAAFDWEPDWSPDGSQIVFTSLSGTGSSAHRDIYRMDADGTNITRLTEDPASDDNPSWSPDGILIAFTSERDGNEEIYVMNADGTGLTRLTNNNDSDWGPSWSPDGRQIAFVSSRDGNDEIYKMSVSGTRTSGVTRLTNESESDWAPSWSPDGLRIAFSSSRDNRRNNAHDIYVMDADGRNVERVTENRVGDWDPSWSPDGRHIAFASERDRNVDIYLIDVASENETRLTTHPGDDYQPSWSPVAGNPATPPIVEEPFELESELSSEDVEVDESFTLKITMSGVQPAGGHGGISVSFPALDADAMGSVAGNIFPSTVADVEKLSYTTGLAHVTFHGPGATIHDSDDEHLTAGYLLVEADDTSWAQGGDRELVLRITPSDVPDDGVLEILVRGWVCDDEYTDCDRQPISSDEPDQQGWPAEELTVRVSEGTDDECETELAEDGSVSSQWVVDCLSENREASYAQFYTFTLTEFSEVTITLESGEDTYLYLLQGTDRDSATLLCENDDHAGQVEGEQCHGIDIDLASSFDSGIGANLDPGNYIIEATTYNTDRLSDFTLTISGIGDVERKDSWEDLALKYAPVLRMHPSEKFFPKGVEALIDNAELKYHDEDVPHLTVTFQDTVTPEMLAPETLDVFRDRLDQQLADRYDGANWYLDVPDSINSTPQAGYPPKLYATIRDHIPGKVYLQYYLFYYYDHPNPGFAQDECEKLHIPPDIPIIGGKCDPHEADWELIQLEFEAETIEDIGSNEKPTRVAYSQHGWAEDSAYDAISTIEGRPIAYVSHGKHATYFGPTPPGIQISQNNPWSLSAVQDHISDRGKELLPPTLSEKYADPCPSDVRNSQACTYTYELELITEATPWVAYEGEWGDSKIDGPDHPDRWDSPHDWMTKVKIPVGPIVVPVELDIADTSGAGRDRAVLNAAFHHWLLPQNTAVEITLYAPEWSKALNPADRHARVTEFEHSIHERLFDPNSPKTIPPSLGDLSHLQRLDVQGNGLTGSIPRQLGYLSNLRELYLNDNNLSGEIPFLLGALPNLETLYLAGSELTGCIPDGLKDVDDNDFEEIGLNFCDGTSPSEPEPPGDSCVGMVSGNGAIAGRWSSDCSSEGRSGSYASYYNFTLAETADVTITAESSVDTWLFLRQGSGRGGIVVADNDDHTSEFTLASTTDSSISESLGAGTYTIEVTTYTAGETGEFTLTIGGLPAAVTPAPELTPTTTIAFGDLNWSSVMLQNRIAQYIAEKGYGYSTSVEFGSTLSLFQALRAGNIDVLMEVWLPNQAENWEAAVAEGYVSSPGRSLGTDWHSSFVIPKYLQEQHPDLDSVEDLKEEKYRSLFATDETDGKARLVSCVIGLYCEGVNAKQIASYGLSDHVHIVNPDSGGALNSDLTEAYENEEAWLGYQWGTNEPALLLDLVRLDEPAYSDECWATTMACAYEDLTILIAIKAGLSGSADDFVDVLTEWDFNVDGVYKPVVRWQADNPDANTEDAAMWWLRENSDLWSDWVTSDASASIQSALDSGETPDGWPEAPNITPDPTPTPEPTPEPPADSCVSAVNGNGAISGSWNSDCVSEGRSGSYAIYYTFTLMESADVTITTESSVDTYLFLREGGNRDGTVIDENDDHDTSEFSLASMTDSGISESLEAGVYTIEVTTYNPAATGQYTLTISVSNIMGWDKDD